MSQQTTNHSFDELARAMVEGSLSRRRALKLIAGTALAALIPSQALAGDDDCVRVCHVPFNRDTEECDFANARTLCVSRRERRRHLENHPCDCRGRCANCLTPPCQPDETGTCSVDTDCCGGFCNSPGTCASCRSIFGPCTEDSQCCFGFCGTGGTCTCTLACGAPCTEDSQCCPGLICDASGGFCVDPGVGCD